MYKPPLTPRQKKLICEAAKVNLKALVILSDKGHQEFDDFIREYSGEDYTPAEANMEVQLQLLEGVIASEDIQNNPELIWTWDRHDLLVLQFIILKELPQFNYPIAKQSLYDKIQVRINHLKSETLLN